MRAGGEARGGEQRRGKEKRSTKVLFHSRAGEEEPTRPKKPERATAGDRALVSFFVFLSFFFSLSLNPDQHNRGKHRILDAPSPTHISLSLFPHHKNPEKN